MVWIDQSTIRPKITTQLKITRKNERANPSQAALIAEIYSLNFRYLSQPGRESYSQRVDLQKNCLQYLRIQPVPSQYLS